MNFSSVIFIFYFLPLSIIGFCLLQKFIPHFVRFYLFLISFGFYLWAGKKIGFLFLFAALLVYVAGSFISKKKSLTVLCVAITLLAGLLVYYKYANFAISIINRVFGQELDWLYLTLPLGISFSVFEAISYLVDVYKGYDHGSLLDFLLFIFFFPKVCSGPIITWNVFKEKLDERKPDFDSLVVGIEQIIAGLGKKVILADVLGALVAKVAAVYLEADSMTLWLCALCFMLQLYLDFSGYSDMAIGISKIFGFNFDRNFNYPYLSKSVGEFFRRWHISLGNFLKKYVYIPLGGNRTGHVYRNLFIVFLISGFWHGDSISYILWGTIIGAAVCLERWLGNKSFYQSLPGWIKWLATLVFIYFTWILFMMPDFSSAILYVRRMFAFVSGTEVPFSWAFYFDRRIIFTIICGSIVSLVDNSRIKSRLDNNVIKYILLSVVLICSIIMTVNSNYSPFLYFRF